MSQLLDELLLHPRTRQQLLNFLKQPSHALILSGPDGSGKKFLAAKIAAGLLEVNYLRLDKHPYFMRISKPQDKQEIPIEAVRQLIRAMSLKVPQAGEGIYRVVLIENAHDLSEEAQNALLKLLEEPPNDTVFILTAPTVADILPTVASRSHNIQIIPASQSIAMAYYKGKYDKARVASAWTLSQGGAGLLSALLAEDTEHPLRSAVEIAKDFLAQDTYGQILILDKLSGNREEFTAVLDALSRVLSALHSAAIRKKNHRQAERLLGARKLVNSAIKSAGYNVSIRLISLHLATSVRL